MGFLSKIATASIAAILISGCNKGAYVEELSYAGSISNFRQIYQEGYFYSNHTYTIAIDWQSLTENSIIHGADFNFPVHWNFDYDNCDIPLGSLLNYYDNKVLVIQGVPTPDVHGLVVYYIAIISNSSVDTDCGEQLQYINFMAAQQMYPLSAYEE